MKIFIVALSLLTLSGVAVSFQPGEGSEEAAIAEQLPTYPFTTCLVSEEPLDVMGEPVDMLYEGKLVRFCCKGCVKQFKKDPATVVSQIDAAVTEQQMASYPMEVCPISGEKLGAMGDPIDMVYGTRLVRLCCKGCVKAFKKDPAKTLGQVDAAYIAAQTKTYPLTACPISGKELGGMGDPIDVLYGTRLVRFCCPNCVKKFKKNPADTIAKIDAAAKAAKKEGTKS